MGPVHKAPNLTPVSTSFPLLLGLRLALRLPGWVGSCPPISTDREAEAVKCWVMSTAKWQEQGCSYQLLRGALWTGQ